MNLEYRVAELERKLNNIIRVGTIEALNDAKALVTVKTGNNTTGWLPWVTRRAGLDKEWWTPEPKEQVLIFSPTGDLAQGIVQPALYSDHFPQNGSDRNIHRIDYRDGGYIEHNRVTGRYKIFMKGDVDIETEKKALVYAKDNVEVTTDKKVIVYAKDDIDMTSDKTIRIHAKKDLELRADKELWIDTEHLHVFEK